MDNETKQLIKQPDQFVSATERGVEWASQNRKTAIIYATTAVALILILVGSYALYQRRTNSASTAFGAAMQTYQTPLANSAQPLPPGMKSFPTEAERAKTANAQFLSVADQYGMTRPGKLAQYFAGLTYMEEGQNASAEDTLKKVSESWSNDIAALGKLALAQLYQQTGRDAQAADIYNELSKGHANTVPPASALIQLGEMYSAEGQTAKAREVFAKVKDSDKDPKGNPGPAAQLATEKLNPTPAAGVGAPSLQ